MREIKFRAWFHDPHIPKHGEMVDMRFCTSEDLVQFNGNALEPTDECTILMQYTGLKDKNGIEIYEGDVVRGWNNESEVKFTQGAFYPEKEYPEVFASCHDEMEVIGNIYENPELL